MDHLKATLSKTIPYFTTWDVILPPKQVSSELVIPVTGFIYITAQAASLTHPGLTKASFAQTSPARGLLSHLIEWQRTIFSTPSNLHFQEHMNIKFITNESLEFTSCFMRVIFATFTENLYSKNTNSYKMFYDIVEFSLRSWFSYSSTNILLCGLGLITYLSLLTHEMWRIIFTVTL